MLTTDALKKLYVAMGGTASDVENLSLTPELIDAIAEIYSGGGSSLPAVTSDDNGKALLVQEGAWDKGTLPSGLPTVTASDNNKSLRVTNGEWSVDANQLVATFSLTSVAGEETWECDKTFAQVKSAIAAGKEIVAKAENVFGVGVHGYGRLISEGNYVIMFSGSGITEQNSSYVLMTFTAVIDSDAHVSVLIGASSVTVS